MNKIDLYQMKDYIDLLHQYDEAYNNATPIVSDKEYDRIYFELQELERRTGTIYPDSPTQSIHYEIQDKLNKIEHNHPMLSLAKTKDWNEFLNYFVSIDSGKDVIGMLKMDGLTCSLEYVDGRLVCAETRGNGRIGEDILANAKTIASIPQCIGYKEHLILDGEVICRKDIFDKYFAKDYANPRNLASGSIRLLDSQECANRHLDFVVWNIIDGFNDTNSFMQKLIIAKNIGFTVVPWTSSFDWDAKEFLIETASELCYPIDGLVGRFDDIEFGASLGATGHHSRAAYAFKFADDEYTTTLLDIDFDVSRNGTLTPVAVFEDVDTGDSTVNRASLHNLTIMEQLLGKPYKNQSLTVIKANMIIPQITWGSRTSDKVSYFELPAVCPICGGPTEVCDSGNSQFLCCANPRCEGKLINIIDHFASKNCLDIKGLSYATIEKLINWGWVNNISDIFSLADYKSEWITKTGFGEASVSKILAAIETARETTLHQLIASLGIPLVGVEVAKKLETRFNTWDNFINAVNDDNYSFSEIPAFGVEMNNSIKNYNYTEIIDLINNHIIIFKINENIPQHEKETLKDQIIVITGALHHFKNRDELKKKIELAGGKVASSVSKKTSFLINNDFESTTGKNKTAKEYNIPILTEEVFLNTYFEE